MNDNPPVTMETKYSLVHNSTKAIVPQIDEAGDVEASTSSGVGSWLMQKITSCIGGNYHEEPNQGSVVYPSTTITKRAISVITDTDTGETVLHPDQQQAPEEVVSSV